jgi:hypothetical protein
LAAADDPLEAARRAAAELCSDPTSDRVGRELRASFTASDVLALTAPVELLLPAFETSKPYTLRVVSSPWSLRRCMQALAVVTSADVTGWSSGEEHEALRGAGVLLVEVLAAGPGGALGTPGAAAALQAARDEGVAAWAVIGTGRALPERLFDAASERAGDRADHLGLDDFALAIGPDLTGAGATVAAQVTCPAGPELLRRPI